MMMSSVLSSVHTQYPNDDIQAFRARDPVSLSLQISCEVRASYKSVQNIPEFIVIRDFDNRNLRKLFQNFQLLQLWISRTFQNLL